MADKTLLLDFGTADKQSFGCKRTQTAIRPSKNQLDHLWAPGAMVLVAIGLTSDAIYYTAVSTHD
jgi:hypothetical protein